MSAAPVHGCRRRCGLAAASFSWMARSWKRCTWTARGACWPAPRRPASGTRDDDSLARRRGAQCCVTALTQNAHKSDLLPRQGGKRTKFTHGAVVVMCVSAGGTGSQRCVRHRCASRSDSDGRQRRPRGGRGGDLDSPGARGCCGVRRNGGAAADLGDQRALAVGDVRARASNAATRRARSAAAAWCPKRDPPGGFHARGKQIQTNWALSNRGGGVCL